MKKLKPFDPFSSTRMLDVYKRQAVGGPFEARGALAEDFDILHDDLWLGQDSFEKAEKKLLEQACETAIDKAGKKKEDIQFFLSGDLMNQITVSYTHLDVYKRQVFKNEKKQ